MLKRFQKSDNIIQLKLDFLLECCNKLKNLFTGCVRLVNYLTNHSQQALRPRYEVSCFLWNDSISFLKTAKSLFQQRRQVQDWRTTRSWCHQIKINLRDQKPNNTVIFPDFSLFFDSSRFEKRAERKPTQLMLIEEVHEKRTKRIQETSPWTFPDHLRKLLSQSKFFQVSMAASSPSSASVSYSFETVVNHRNALWQQLKQSQAEKKEGAGNRPFPGTFFLHSNVWFCFPHVDIVVSLLPDGKEITVKANVTSPLQILSKENKKLLKGAVCTSVRSSSFTVSIHFSSLWHLFSRIVFLPIVFQVDGTLWDLSRPLEKSCKLSVVDFESPEGKHVFWHSTAHVLGQALEIKYNGQLTVG